MTEFLAAIVVFVVAHVVLPVPAIRSPLIRLAGRRGYLLGYSLLSIGLIAWVVIAARRAPYTPLWALQPWHALVLIVLMPVAAWLLIGGLAEPNPLSISLRSTTDASVGPVARITRHPVLWAFVLWAGGHTIANGDLVSLIMFGGLTLLAIAGFPLVDRRARRRLGAARWTELAHATSIIPFAAVAAGRARFVWTLSATLWAIVALGGSIWFAVDGHARLIGLDPLAIFGS